MRPKYRVEFRPDDPIVAVRREARDALDAGSRERVYFIAAGNFDRRTAVKIGWTDGQPERRLATLQSAHHTQLRLVTAVPGSRRLESALHRMFSGSWIRGEWFWATPAMREIVVELTVAFLGDFQGGGLAV